MKIFHSEVQIAESPVRYCLGVNELLYKIARAGYLVILHLECYEGGRAP